MDIFLKYELYYDENDRLAFNNEFFYKQRETLENLFGDEPLDIRVYQRNFEKKLFDRNDNYSAAVQTIINDIKDPQSVLNRLYRGLYEEEGQSDLDRKIRIFREQFILLVMRQYDNFAEEQGAFYALNYYKKYEFKFFLPIKLLAEKFKDNIQTIDLSALTNDEIIEHVVPDYYLAVGYWDRDKLRAKKEEMATLGKEWLNEYNQVVNIVG